MSKKVSRANVMEACHQLIARGQTCSLRNIRAILGGGSMRDLTKMVRDVTEQRETAFVCGPTSSMQGLADIFPAYVHGVEALSAALWADWEAQQRRHDEVISALNDANGRRVDELAEDQAKTMAESRLAFEHQQADWSEARNRLEGEILALKCALADRSAERQQDLEQIDALKEELLAAKALLDVRCVEPADIAVDRLAPAGDEPVPGRGRRTNQKTPE